MSEDKVIIFDGIIDTDGVTHLINQVDLSKNNTIYFSSSGGDKYLGDVLIDFINKHKTKINLIAFKEISSEGFNIFFSVQCFRGILPWTDAKIHLGSNSINETRELLKEGMNWSKLTLEQFPIKSNEYIGWLKGLGIEQDELNQILKGGEILLTYEQLNELLIKNG